MGTLSPDLFVYPFHTPLRTTTGCFKTALIPSPSPCKHITQNTGIEFLSSAFQSDETPVQPLKKANGLSFVANEVWICSCSIPNGNIYPQPGGYKTCESEIWRKPLCYYEGCYGDDYAGEER